MRISHSGRMGSNKNVTLFGKTVNLLAVIKTVLNLTGFDTTVQYNLQHPSYFFYTFITPNRAATNSLVARVSVYALTI
jgi:hypothetical protein